jgi:hypothetical protein
MIAPWLKALLISMSVTVAAMAQEEKSSRFQSVGSFQIQSFPEQSGNWFEAAEACALKYRARLCRPAEWIAACRSKRIGLSGQPEWVDQLAPLERFSSEFTALALFPDCNGANWGYPYKDYFPFRCCRDLPSRSLFSPTYPLIE